MASLTIRDLDEGLKQRLRIRAAHRHRSMEEEARQILREALAEAPAPAVDLGQRIRARFSSIGGVDLPVTPREAVRTPPALDAPPPKQRR